MVVMRFVKHLVWLLEQSKDPIGVICNVYLRSFDPRALSAQPNGVPAASQDGLCVEL
jgi:hypothetical protein